MWCASSIFEVYNTVQTEVLDSDYSFRNYRAANYQEINCMLSFVEWDRVMALEDINDIVNEFDRIL